MSEIKRYDLPCRGDSIGEDSEGDYVRYEDYLKATTRTEIPPNCDVRKILIDMHPSEDGMGHEVYAQNVWQVENLLSKLSERIDELQHNTVSQDRIREIFMAHGFTIKEGQTDLKQYVYDAARALLAEVGK